MFHPTLRCTAFAGSARIASGELRHVALKAKQAFDAGKPVLVFEDASGRVVELPLELPAGDLLKRLAEPAASAVPVAAKPPPPRGPGRPKLGVVAREVTLLPRHWDWLSRQPGGASVALRRLVEEARRIHQGRDSVRESREATYRFMTAMAGSLEGFEEAARALFAGDQKRFAALVAPWPVDVSHYLQGLAAASWSDENAPT